MREGRPFPGSRSPATEYFTFGLASWHGAPWRFDRFHRHDEIELCFIEQGSLTHLFGSGRVTFQKNQISLFWGAVPHQLVDFSKGTLWHLLTIPLSWFLQWQLPGSMTDQILHGKVVFDPKPSNPEIDLSFFKRWHADLRARDPQRVKLVMAESESRLRRLALSRRAVSHASPQGLLHGNNSGRVERMASFIARNYTQRIRVPQIAAAAGLHPDYAVTLFRKTCGMGLIDYLNEHRVSHAQRLLAVTDRKVLDVAFDSGFNSVSRFHAVFANLCGKSPRKYRVMSRVHPAHS